ncbi:glycogen debranching protein GlgX [Cypionkella sp.]|uniref:glycogen debranching protein GlgX n=1 Tax=Cypionkella sp. TaxID=2811411 RepID=UPI0026078B55|nr:glycogen debranching protein GlgX [Cypionkella sp.]
MSLLTYATSRGRPWPMGATLTDDGVNFAVFSAHATALELCLYSPDGRREEARLAFADRDGDVWHLHVAGLVAGQLYGLRAYGPYAPDEGQRFNPHKLLIDPYARGLAGRLRWSDAVMGYKVGASRGDGSFDPRDSAFAVPKSVVVDAGFHWGNDRPPLVPMADTVIYEAHVKALTMRHPGIPQPLRGTYAGLAHPVMIEHFKRLGVTTVELLPVQAYFDDRFLVAKGLRNHWGYQTMGYFAPEPRYGGATPLREIQSMVKALHAAGLEVVLDVVYNHTGEGDAWGPTLSFRGLDNLSYYRLIQGGRHYANDAGTGNTLDLTNPAVLRMVMDSLRYWVQEVHIDGFRFDLATVLGREPNGFDPQGGFFDAIRQDPVLARVKLIAEPWDLGPGGYQLGAYPPPFSEWNDKYRDGVRRFWRNDAGLGPEFSRRLMGSADKFDHSRRPATASVNFITSHDGFTLEDLVSYTIKRNLANGEDNRDGHDDNHADNMGVEGPSPDPLIRDARDLRKRNLLATLMLSQGTPMLLAGDELGHSQGGNNNAYAQDNDLTRIDWASADTDLVAFVAKLIALRKAHPVLRQNRFLHAHNRLSDGLPDAIWRRGDAAILTPNDWNDPSFRCIGLELRMAAEGPDQPDALYLVFNGGGTSALRLPDTATEWLLILDSTRPDLPPELHSKRLEMPPQSVFVFEPLRARGAT